MGRGASTWRGERICPVLRCNFSNAVRAGAADNILCPALAKCPSNRYHAVCKTGGGKSNGLASM